MSADAGGRPATIDAARLPGAALDVRQPQWWGNGLLLTIESTTLALLIVTYFYLRRNAPLWPPPRVDTMPPIAKPLPKLGAGTLNLVVLLASCVPMAWADRAARRLLAGSPTVRAGRPGPEPRPAGERRGAFIGVMALLTVLGLVSVALRFVEFRGVQVPWDANAYGSIVWSILALHLTYIAMSAWETALLGIWVTRRGLTEKFAMDATLTAGSWYWTVAVWIVLYLVVYWTPRLS